jgi:osmotically inducible protein OsmC
MLIKGAPMDLLYTAVATARGGREGEVVSDDGVLDLLLAHPKELGGPGGDTTNPEQLFAAGYSACFHSALKRVAGAEKLDVTGSSITAHVGLGIDGAVFGLAVTLVGQFPTLDEAAGHALMEKAHQVCPYSRATRGNIEVTLQVG